MKRILTELVITCLLSPAAHAQTWQWAQRAGDTGNEAGNAIDVDDQGKSYISGTFHGSATFGSITLTDTAATSVFLAAYDASGNVLWARVAASGVVIEVHGITRDPLGYISIVGEYLGSTSFGDPNSVTVTSGGDHDVFVARYDDTGDLTWARSFGGAGYDFGIGISHDAVGNLYATGDLHYGSFSGSASKVYVVKYDPNGDQVWLKLPPDYSNFHVGNGIATDDAGNSYIVGTFFNAITFEPITADAGNIESNIFLAKVDADGNGLWVQKGGAGSGYCGGRAVDIDAVGDAYITGDFHGTIDLGPLNLSSTPTVTLVAKCSTDGVFQWVNKAGGPNSCASRSIGVDGTGACYLAGLFSSSIFIGTTELVPTGPGDLFIARVDPSGNFTWATAAHSTAGMGVGGIRTIDSDVLMTGTFSGTVDFGGSIQLTTAGGTDVFVARLHDDAVGIAEGGKTSVWGIYPNPTMDRVQLDGLVGQASFAIRNSAGALLLSGTTNGTTSIDVRALEPGIYFMRAVEVGGAAVPCEVVFVREP